MRRQVRRRCSQALGVSSLLARSAGPEVLASGGQSPELRLLRAELGRCVQVKGSSWLRPVCSPGAGEVATVRSVPCPGHGAGRRGEFWGPLHCQGADLGDLCFPVALGRGAAWTLHDGSWAQRPGSGVWPQPHSPHLWV